MPTETHYTPAARSYAQALFELADEQRQPLEELGLELRDLRQIIDTNPLFGRFLADPSIGAASRAAVLDKALKGRVSPLLGKFLGLVNEKGRLGLLPQIAVAYDHLMDETFGKVEVDVTVAHPLDAEQLEQVRQQVGLALGKDAIVHQYVDESIIGGLVLRVQDQLIDASVRYQLQAMKHRLLTNRPPAAGRTGFEIAGAGDGNARAY